MPLPLQNQHREYPILRHPLGGVRETGEGRQRVRVGLPRREPRPPPFLGGLRGELGAHVLALGDLPHPLTGQPKTPSDPRQRLASPDASGDRKIAFLGRVGLATGFHGLLDAPHPSRREE